MFFRHLVVYRLTQPVDFDAVALEAALATKPARPCANQEFSTYGFVAPIGKGAAAPLVHASHGFIMIAARQEERILPGSVVRDAVAEKVEQIEADELRKVYKKERDQIKDNIIQAFMPRAFIRKATTFAAIDRMRGLIYVDASSPRRAENLLSTLREAIGSLPVRPLSVNIAPSANMTGWVKNEQAPADFHILDETTLRDSHEEGGSIVAKHQDLTSDEIKLHVSSGKVVTKLALGWQDKLSFVIDDSMVIARLRFDDLLQEQAEKDGGDDAAGQLDASFVLMMLTLRDFIPALVEVFGGESIPQLEGASTGTALPDLPASAYPPGAVDLTVALQESLPPGVTATLVSVNGLAGDDAEVDWEVLFQRDVVEATKFVRDNMRASTSSLQRKFKWGYNRAARMIEELEARGVVTAMNSNGSREVIR